MPREKVGDQQVPSSEDVERAVLSCILQNPDALLSDAITSTDPEIFYWPAYRMLFEQIVAFGSRSGEHPLDIATLSQFLIDRGMMEKLGGPAFLSGLLDFVAAPESYSYYRSILLDKLKLRTALDSANAIIGAVYSNQGDLEQAEKEIESHTTRINSVFSKRERGRTWDEEVDDWSEDWDAMASGSKESAMETRWNSWNSEIGGIDPGYTIISGRSSSGKSCLLGNILMDASLNKNRPALFISYEMPVRMVISRMVADLADVDGMHIFRPDKAPPREDQRRDIFKALSRIRKSRIRVVHNHLLSAEGACHIARKMFLKEGDLVMGVDYLQIAPRPQGIEKGANREREISTISSTFRSFSKEIDRPVIVLSQLNQDGSTRESTSIMMDADTHVKVDRDKDKRTGKITDKGISVEKARNGRSDFYLPIHLLGSRFRFEEK